MKTNNPAFFCPFWDLLRRMQAESMYSGGAEEAAVQRWLNNFYFSAAVV
jgi:hypothetical protein